MQPEENNEQSVAISDYWRVLLERRWLILGTLFVCWLVAWGAGWLMPASYRSETLIIVEQQKIPEQYVVPNVSSDLQQRLQTMTEQIMSRTRLQKIIDDFHLYGNESGHLSSEQLIARMRKDIDVQLVQSSGNRDVDAFHIYYSAPSPQLSQKILNELTSLFIQENLRAQQELSQITTEFLTSELDQARASLAEQEAKVREFKSQYLGALPTQVQSNMNILSGLQSQQENLSASLNRSQQQKLYLESLLEQYRNANAATTRSGQSVSSIDDELSRLRSELAAAQARYTDQNPDVVRLKNEIARAEKLKQSTDARRAAGDQGDKAPISPSSPMAQVQAQLKANAQEIKSTEAQVRALDQQIRSYQGRLNAAPAVEQKLADLTRDYDESKANYDSLLKKQLQSQMATNLEKKQQGQQFRVLDPPSLPQKPFSPKRMKIALGGLAAGLALGIALAVLLELFDPRVWTEKHLKGLVAGRVLVAIPHIMTTGEERRANRRFALECTTVVLIFLVMLVGNAFTFLKG